MRRYWSTIWVTRFKRWRLTHQETNRDGLALVDSLC